MSVAGLVAGVLLTIAGLVAVIAVVGVWRMPGAYNRLHYLAPVSIVSSVAIAAAVVARETLNGRGLKALLVAAMLGALNPLLVHETARVARARQRAER